MNIVGAITNFTCVVESGTLASAARSLGVSAASVSQNIARLEEHLGVRLLARTTRQMALTEAGRVYYDKVRHIPRELDLARQAISRTPHPQWHQVCSGCAAGDYIGIASARGSRKKRRAR